jgi:hypothetical protein
MVDRPSTSPGLRDGGVGGAHGAAFIPVSARTFGCLAQQPAKVRDVGLAVARGFIARLCKYLHKTSAYSNRSFVRLMFAYGSLQWVRILCL